MKKDKLKPGCIWKVPSYFAGGIDIYYDCVPPIDCQNSGLGVERFNLYKTKEVRPGEHLIYLGDIIKSSLHGLMYFKVLCVNENKPIVGWVEEPDFDLFHWMVPKKRGKNENIVS